MKIYKFPKDFWWGVSITANQSEGAWLEDGRTLSSYDKVFKDDPWRFEDLKHGPDKASDFYHKYKEDIQLAKEMGLNTFRLTISWSRLIPNGMSNGVNPKAINFYRDVFKEIKEAGMEPFVALMCFDTPAYLWVDGGIWDREEIIDEFEYYARQCFKNFGDLVKKWFSAVEAGISIKLGYQQLNHPPYVSDFKRFTQAMFNWFICNAKFVKAYKEAGIKGDVGTLHVVHTTYPMGSMAEDFEAANIEDMLDRRVYLDVYIKGRIPDDVWSFWEKHNVTPKYTQEDLNLISENTISLLGLNYYSVSRVRAPQFAKNPNAPLNLNHFVEHVQSPAGGRRAFGREIYEKGLLDALYGIRDEYDNFPCYVSENGVRIVENSPLRNERNEIQDDERIEFTKNHLVMISKAISEGCNCLGYHPFTFMDSWSWVRAYSYKYGFVEVNLNTMERRRKKSFYWYKSVINKNRIEENDDD